MAFVKDDPSKATGLVASMQKLASANKTRNLRSFVVFTSGPEVKDAIQKLASEEKITIPMTFLPGGPGAADFQAYKVNPEARNTVLLYNRHTVVGNFVNIDQQSFPEVEKAALEMLAK